MLNGPFISRCQICLDKHEPKCEGHEAVIFQEKYQLYPIASQKTVDDMLAAIFALRKALEPYAEKSDPEVDAALEFTSNFHKS